MFIGIGGGPEGVIAASALDAYGCFFQGRFLFTENNDIKRAKSMGIKDLKKKYEINEIVSGDSIFVATGITDGDLTKGIKINKNKFISQTLITHKSSNTREIRINESEIF
jgi:fructose-1,6-bisphosphatase II / sedoheptulose-1,7-bisphosphatase